MKKNKQQNTDHGFPKKKIVTASGQNNGDRKKKIDFEKVVKTIGKKKTKKP